MRSFNAAQKALLRSDMEARLLVTFYLDSGTYRFCDDVVNMYNGQHIYIGASALLGSVEIRSGDDLAAEPVTLYLDGNRMTQFGIQDPAKVLAEIMQSLASQRRVDWALGLSAIDSEEIQITIPIFAGKINSYRLIDDSVELDSKDEVPASLEIVIDALASRYNHATNRTRSHEDQQEIAPGDMFYSFTVDAQDSEQLLYWGKKAPRGTSSGGGTWFGNAIIKAEGLKTSVKL